MIPIVSIFNLVSAFFFGGASLKIYFSYLKNREEKLGDFLKVFLLLTILLNLLATLGLIFWQQETIGLVYALYPFLAFMGLAYLGTIPLSLMNWQRIKKIFFNLTVAIAFLVTLLNILNWGPAVVHYQDSFVYWEDTRGVSMNVMIGLFYGLILILVISFFLIQGFRSSERFVKIRSLFIAAGLFFLALTSLVNFVFGASAQEYLDSLIAAVFNILAGTFILIGIYYKPQKSY